MIFIRWGSQQFGENRFQSVRPYLVPLDVQVKLISIEHALEQLAGSVCELFIYIQIPDLFAVGKFRDIFVNLIDDGHYRHIVVAGSDAHQDDRSVGSLSIADIQDRFDSRCDVCHPWVPGGLGRGIANIVGARKHNDDFRIDVIQFPIIQPPKYVLDLIATPAKVRGIPAEEILAPVRQKIFVLFIAGAPPPGDRVAFKVD